MRSSPTSSEGETHPTVESPWTSATRKRREALTLSMLSITMGEERRIGTSWTTGTGSRFQAAMGTRKSTQNLHPCRAHGGRDILRGARARGCPQVTGRAFGATRGEKGSPKGIGKGKGTSKGKAQFFGQCYHCFEWGHSQNWRPYKEQTQEWGQKGKGWGKPTSAAHNVEETSTDEDPTALEHLESQKPRQPLWVMSCEDTKTSITLPQPTKATQRPGQSPLTLLRNRFQVLAEHEDQDDDEHSARPSIGLGVGGTEALPDPLGRVIL